MLWINRIVVCLAHHWMWGFIDIWSREYSFWCLDPMKHLWMDTEIFALILFVDILARFMTRSGDSHYDDPFCLFLVLVCLDANELLDLYFFNLVLVPQPAMFEILYFFTPSNCGNPKVWPTYKAPVLKKLACLNCSLNGFQISRRKPLINEDLYHR